MQERSRGDNDTKKEEREEEREKEGDAFGRKIGRNAINGLLRHWLIVSIDSTRCFPFYTEARLLQITISRQIYDSFAKNGQSPQNLSTNHAHGRLI